MQPKDGEGIGVVGRGDSIDVMRRQGGGIGVPAHVGF
jgi:hypothetical protein